MTALSRPWLSRIRRGDAATTVAVRLEGGIGDHVLGMRVLPFIKDRFPNCVVSAYSDAGGYASQISILRMSPYVEDAVPISRIQSGDMDAAMGHINAVDPRDLRRMHSADVFIDAWGGDYFTEASRILNTPVFDILSHRSELRIDEKSQRHASEYVGEADSPVPYIALNLTKYGVDVLRHHRRTLSLLLTELTRERGLKILHFYPSSYQYPHWPPEKRKVRELLAIEEARFCDELSDEHDLIRCKDLPIGTVAALIARCRYFIGVDNGLKHVAWALGVPRLFFMAVQFPPHAVIRWMPDYHCAVRFDIDATELNHRIADIWDALK